MEQSPQVILWKLQVSIKAFERRIDRYWRDQDNVNNYEAPPSSDHSDQAGNDISPDSSDNDLDIHRSNDFRPVKDLSKRQQYFCVANSGGE